MGSPQEAEVTLVADFISTRAPQFHSAFGAPSELNRSTMQYELPDVRDLRDTLECHQQKAKKYVDFTVDLNNCTWDDVHKEMRKAKATAEESERRGKHPVKMAWRTIGTSASILAPGLVAIPDHLCVLNGGLAVIFSVSSRLSCDPFLIDANSTP